MPFQDPEAHLNRPVSGVTARRTTTAGWCRALAPIRPIPGLDPRSSAQVSVDSDDLWLGCDLDTRPLTGSAIAEAKQNDLIAAERNGEMFSNASRRGIRAIRQGIAQLASKEAVYEEIPEAIAVRDHICPRQ